MAQKKKPAKTKKAPAPPETGKDSKKKIAAKNKPEKKAPAENAVKAPAKKANAEASSKPRTPSEKKLVKMKQKMHREIFEKCVEKHFYSGLSDWDEVAIPDKDSDDFVDDDEDDID